MDTEKQRQCRRNGMRLTESRNARSEHLLVVPTESLTNREWLLGELYSGSERRRPGLLLDMEYLTSSLHRNITCRELYTYLFYFIPTLYHTFWCFAILTASLHYNNMWANGFFRRTTRTAYSKLI